ncbi:Clathrin light chain [Hypoxylon texense]
MRLASITLRDAKPKHFVLHSPLRFQLPPRPFRLCIGDAQLPACQYGRGTRRFFSTASLNNPDTPADIFLSRLSNSLQAIRNAHTQQQKSEISLIQETSLFGKWRPLLTDPFRLAVESDFDRQGPAKSWRSQLLVDKFENRGDLALWSALLDYQKRINGNSGVLNVWKGLWGRKTLYDVSSPLAPAFWQTILEAAVNSDNDDFLTSIWIYSEWMYDLHGVKWPELYSTVISQFLRTHQHQQALQWQLRLTPTFYPGANEFAGIIKQFATDHGLYETPTLESLYIVNPDHQLYDILVPYLYSLGASKLAARWRRLCIRHDDLPRAPVPVRPFLRFLQGYFPHVSLHPEESDATSDFGLEAAEEAKRIEISREFVNRVHGGTFGISVKNYNDRLGAKWLASSWVALDTAISTIAALGIEQIGPLSLQSIALREGTSKGVLNRIEQLQEQGITVVESNYLRLVLYLARIKDDQLLLDLLQSDLHPDVFDDVSLQERLVISTAESEDWRAHRLLLATRLVVMEKSAREVANALARIHILRRDYPRLSKLLNDMKAMEVTINHDQTSLIFDSLVTEAKSTFFPKESLYFFLSVCRQLASMEIPVPVRCWRKLLFSLARQGRIDDLEKVCIELVDMFTSLPSSRPGFAPVHPEDIPEPMKKPLSGVQNLLGVYIPLDLPTDRPLHPLRQVFDTKLLGTTIRCSFYSCSTQQGGSVATPALPTRRPEPGSFYGGRAVKLMRMLYDRGLFVDRQHLATWVKLRLVDLYGPGYPTKRALQRVKANNSLSLAEMKTLLDETWGEEFLPPIETLQAQIETRGRKAMSKYKKYLQEMGKTTPELRVVL